MSSADQAITVEIDGSVAKELPSTSIFSSIAEVSSFFEGGAVGYSVTGDRDRLDGLRLKKKSGALNRWMLEKQIRVIFLTR
jgi:hypothetical protein